MKKNPLRLRVIVAAALVLLILLADQIIKFGVKTNMALYERIDVTDWCKLLFIENRGMAFGMDFIGTMFLTLFRVAAIVLFSFILVRIVRKKAPVGLIVCFALVVAGAAGNIIDNCFYGLIYSESVPGGAPAQLVPWGEGYSSFLSGKVVDMFYFPLFRWPSWVPLIGGDVFFGAIFNFADAAISCGAIAILLFYRRYFTADYLLRRSRAGKATGRKP